MAIACPPCQWPTVLEERGPSEDPTILLTGAARIGEAHVQIVAIRINSTLQWTPDYRSDVAEDSYHVDGLDEVLETTLDEFQCIASELGEVLGNSRSSLVELAPGRYRVWVMPWSFGS